MPVPSVSETSSQGMTRWVDALLRGKVVERAVVLEPDELFTSCEAVVVLILLGKRPATFAYARTRRRA